MKRIDTSKWKEFRIGDLFTLSLSTDDLQPKNFIKGDVPLISSGKTNNGVVAYIQNDATLQSANTITVDMFGKAFYQNKPYYCVSHGRVNILAPMFNMTECCGLYLASVIEHVSRKKYEYNEMCTGVKLADDLIKLPATVDGHPDFDYMDLYMQALLDKSMDDLNHLRQVKMANKSNNTSTWKEYVIGELFEKLSLGIKKQDFNKALDVSEVRTSEFNLPLVNAKHGNNGIMYYGREGDFESAEMTIDIVQNGAIATGDVYAQPQKTGVLWDAYLIKPLFEVTSKFALMFMATVLEKAIKDKFSYDNKCVWDKASKLIVKLPATVDGSPDVDYMDSYMQKTLKQAKENLDLLTNAQI